MLFESENSACTIIDIFCEFIEIAIHSILHVRKLYPDTIFEPKRKYGAVVYHSIHPGVNEYILNCVNTIRFHLKTQQLRNVFLCFNSKGAVLERYNFEILEINSSLESDPFLMKLEQYFHDFCLKLHEATNCLEDLPSLCTFSIQLQVTEFSNQEFNQEFTHEGFPWVNLVNRESSLIPKILPFHSVKSDFLKIQTYTEKFS